MLVNNFFAGDHNPIPAPSNVLLPYRRSKGLNIRSVYMASKAIPLSSKVMDQQFPAESKVAFKLINREVSFSRYLMLFEIRL